ncbi:MAG: hypothetical protein EB037_10555 [Actinobacteria bacterium]|nr:hypothetical protein [Actinomycetota bacterium]
MPATNPPTAPLQRYWFQIKATNTVHCIHAVSFTEAKQQAAATFLANWSAIEWLSGPASTN